MKVSMRLLVCLAVAMMFLAHTPATASAKTYVFTGGKAGGTSIYYANAVAALAKKAGMKFLVNSSGGAVEQIRLVNSGKSSFSLAYAGQLFAAERGQLKGDPRKYTDVQAMAYFYGAPAQLIVKADSDIKSAKDLVGKRVGVGNAGSGAAANAELFFTELGIWDKIDRNFIGYRQAADAFKNSQLDAFWVFVSFPNASVIEAAMQNKIRLIDLYADAQSCGLLKKYPYFSKVVIPAGTYQGVDTDTASFQDKTIWIVNNKVPEDVVYKTLKTTFSKEGLTHMVNAHKSAKAMSLKTSGKGIVSPMHPGATKFWKESGALK
jgi:TRAP transporter TAXI family solute receptor